MTGLTEQKRDFLPGFLSNNALKLLALFAMTCDHVGLQLLPQLPVLRIIGRLAFPIFAYMIAEGCRYTRDRKRYLLTLSIMALAYQLVYLVAMGSLYQGIFVTFSLSVAVILALDTARKQRTAPAVLIAVGVLAAVMFVCVPLPRILHMTDFAIDYDIWGVLLPVAVYFAPNRVWRLAAAAPVMVVLCLSWGGYQWWSLLALLPLACYNGKRGRYRMKNLFYIYYPAHLAVIYLLDMIW